MSSVGGSGLATLGGGAVQAASPSKASTGTLMQPVIQGRGGRGLPPARRIDRWNPEFAGASSRCPGVPRVPVLRPGSRRMETMHDRGAQARPVLVQDRAEPAVRGALVQEHRELQLRGDRVATLSGWPPRPPGISQLPGTRAGLGRCTIRHPRASGARRLVSRRDRTARPAAPLAGPVRRAAGPDPAPWRTVTAMRSRLLHGPVAVEQSGLADDERHYQKFSQLIVKLPVSHDYQFSSGWICNHSIIPYLNVLHVG